MPVALPAQRPALLGPELALHRGTQPGRSGAAAATGSRYIDTVPWFCSTTCTDVIGRYQPYWDPYHVTAAYAEAVGQTLAIAIDLPAYPPLPHPPPAKATSGTPTG